MRRLLSQSGGFGEVDPEALPPAFVAPCGVGRAMAELALHESLLDVRSRREAGPQRVPAKGNRPRADAAERYRFVPIAQVRPECDSSRTARSTSRLRTRATGTKRTYTDSQMSCFRWRRIRMF